MTTVYSGYRPPVAYSGPLYSPYPSIVARLGALLWRVASAPASLLRRCFQSDAALHMNDHLVRDMGLASSHKDMPAVRPYWRL